MTTSHHTDHAAAYALAQALMTGAREDGGATVDPATGHAPAGGYMVGAAGRGTVLHNLDSVAIAAAWVSRTLPRLAPGECLGSWVDGGLVYLDVSANLANLADALDLAQRTGELAIWDVAAAREIRTAA